jgi:N-acetylglucosaminyldiphosphoundecaprenol N-acetyl-beta-D-mannosaminyltransferase
VTVVDRPSLSVFGVPIADLDMREAMQVCIASLRCGDGRRRAVFFANAHTLNNAASDPSYAGTLRSGDWVFGDGTGVRWAVRWLYGVRLRDNVNGTDLVPALLGTPLALRYYLLGTSSEAIERAARHARQAFPGWELVGYHHGYLPTDESAALVDEINAAQPHLLLVGMGNPKQERWIAAQLGKLTVPLTLAVGGLLDYWAGDLTRAPVWMRKLGMEWFHLLLAQPWKFRRYVLGNPLFLARLVRAKWSAAAP